MITEFPDGIAGHVFAENLHRRVRGDRVLPLDIGGQYCIEQFIGAGLSLSPQRGETVRHLNGTDLIVSGETALFSPDFLSTTDEKIKDGQSIAVIRVL